MKRLPVLLWLAVVWVLLWGSLTPGDFLNGLLVALFVTLVLPLPDVSLGGRLHPVGLARFAAHFVADLFLASGQVAWLAVRPGPPPTSSVVRVELSDDSELVTTLVTEAVSLVPGSIVVDLDGRFLYAHVLGAGSARDVAAFRERTLQLERRILAAVGDREIPGPYEVHA